MILRYPRIWNTVARLTWRRERARRERWCDRWIRGGADGGTRTRTRSRAVVFKTTSSTVPTRRLATLGGSCSRQACRQRSRAALTLACLGKREATVGIEPTVRVLQTLALPLG